MYHERSVAGQRIFGMVVQGTAVAFYERQPDQLFEIGEFDLLMPKVP